MNLCFAFTPNGITKLLLKTISCLLIANLCSIYLRWELGYNTGFGFIPLFDFDQEYNIPTLYSSLAILISAALLWFIAKDKTTKEIKHSFYWKALSFIFMFLSLDELTSIHNQLARLIGFFFSNLSFISNEEYISRSRFWIIIYTPLLLLFTIFLIRFYLTLPNQTKSSFFIAGLVFVAGAIGVELLGDRYMYFHDIPDINYALLYTLEELLEMIGIILFIRALISYISTYLATQNIRVQIYLIQKKNNALFISEGDSSIKTLDKANIHVYHH